MYAGARFRAWLGYSGRVTRPRRPRPLRRAARHGPGRRRRDGGLARGDRARRPARRAAVRLRRGRRLVAARSARPGFAVVFVPDAVVLHRARPRPAAARRRRTSTTRPATRSTSPSGARPLPRGLRGLRRGVVVATHLAQAVSHPRAPRGVRRRVLEGWRDAAPGAPGPMPLVTGAWPPARWTARAGRDRGGSRGVRAGRLAGGDHRRSRRRCSTRAEHVRYAAYLDEHHRIPSKDENYEYASPPLFHVVAIAAEHVVGAVPARPLELRVERADARRSGSRSSSRERRR